MTTVYWYCLLGGLSLSVLLVFLGDVLEAAMDALDGALDALDLGGVFDPLSGVGHVPEVTIAATLGVAAAVALHLIYVKPMKASENSTGFSVREYAGKTGELTTGVPEGGFGEVIVRMGASTTFQTAASFSGAPIPSGTAVVVVEVDREGVLRVAPLDREDLTVATDASPRARLQTR